MAKLQRNFIKGKMNKGLDERLIPNGEYIDALNIRVGSTELSEIGAVENTKGNSKLTTLGYLEGNPPNLYPLSANAKCIGAFEDGANETIYWFVTDPSNTGPQATNKLDLIVSYNTNDDSVTYHVVSVDDGGNVNTTLNFNSQYLITGVDKVDDLLFFTDNYNQPRVINVTKDYPSPTSTIDDPILGEQLLVIKKPPINSPTFQLVNTGSEENFVKDRFICFAYRYRYEDDMYSATSQFSNVAFIPNGFHYDVASNLNEGMENSFNNVSVTVKTGSSLVVGIDLLFKEASNPVIRLIEKLDKEELGIPDNSDYNFEFSNSKIYSLLDDNEILRLYDNVPLKAKAQTIMGSRLVYGNYIEGYDVDTKDLDYTVDYISEKTNITQLQTTITSGQYDMMATGVSTRNNSVVLVDFADVLAPLGNGLKSGTRLTFNIRIQGGTQELVSSVQLTSTPLTDVFFSYTLAQDFNSVQDLMASQDFLEKVGTNLTVSAVADSCSSFTFTDEINCAIPNSKVDQSTGSVVYSKIGAGISPNTLVEGIFDPNVYTGSVAAPTVTSTQIAIQLPASLFAQDGFPLNQTTEYCEITFAQVFYEENIKTASLHSDRNYEAGIIYMDDFGRSTTVLVNQNNAVYIPCSESINKNTLKIEIPPKQIPPPWAKRYKFAIKQDKDLYETIYSDFFFNDPNTEFSYFLLEGENAQKVEKGDVLKVKADASAPVLSCKEITILSKEAQEKDFIDNIIDPATNQNVSLPSGVYAKIKSNLVDLGIVASFSYVRNAKDESINFYPVVAVAINFEGSFLNPLFIDESLNEGDIINFELRYFRDAKQAFLGCPRRNYSLSQEYRVSKTYLDFKSWWEGDNIVDTLGYGTEELGNGANRFLSNVPPYNDFFVYDSNVYQNNDPNNQILSPFLWNQFMPFNDQDSFIRFYRDISNKKYLLIRSSSKACFNNTKRLSIISLSIRITRATGMLVFETKPQDAAPDIWYESPVSYPITGGFHTGNVQNQSAVQPAIIHTAFQNCFSFGNGVESYKIKDSITRSMFNLGNRVSSVLKNNEFEQVHRFADLTYSGTYGYNVNNLNEFNLGLLNFKVLEPSFGFVQKLFARTTDILVLQEDKVSYVLAGKNLLSDSAAGGVITSAPDVLGTQIARIEEYGIGSNPESFACYGYEKYFTDSKRGVVIQLKGSGYSNEQLSVISSIGLSSWFRNLFIEKPNTQKLGGYDPYSKEYVLSSNSLPLPVEVEIVEAGVQKAVVATPSAPVTYTVDLGPFVGDATLKYNVRFIRNSFTLRVTYNSINYDTTLSAVSSGTVTIPKTLVEPQTAVLSVTSVSSISSSKIELDVEITRPDAPTMSVIQVCVSDSNENAKTIHNEYRWTSGSFSSPLHSEFVSLAKGTASPLVSHYNKITGFQGGGVVPINGASVEIISKKYQSDNFAFDNSVNNFGVFRSNTLYNNTPTDIAALIAASTPIAPTGSGDVFSGSFTMPSNTNQYLYLIYDYRKPVAIDLNYSNTSISLSCCGTSSTLYIDAPIFEQATAVYTTSALTTKAADGWYSYQGVYRKQTSGVLETPILCPACNLACGTSLAMSTERGFYNIIADLGSATGAVIINIDFKTLPEGIKVVYDGVTYNAVYSPNFGYLNSPGTNPLYAGITAFDCGISGTTYSALVDYRFNGNGFNPTGQIKSVTVDPTSVFLQASGLGTCKMIIPKTAASPSTAEITIISPCASSEITVDVLCPTALSAWESYQATPSGVSSGLCVSGATTIFYHALVTGTAGNPGIGDIIYLDANGSTIAAEGYYSVIGAEVIQVDANGRVISTPACS